MWTTLVTLIALTLHSCLGQTAPNIIVKGDKFLMVMNSVDVFVRSVDANQNKKASFTKLAANATVTGNGTFSSAVLNFKAPDKSDEKLSMKSLEITLSFEKEKDGWSMRGSNVKAEGSSSEKPFKFESPLLTEKAMSASLKQSYHCSQYGSLYPTTTAGNFTMSMEIKGLQVAPFTENNAAFTDDVYECVGFFSIGILSGVFVTVMLLAIISWGLSMIMDVKTMDRFDDPKGKPLSFGGAE